MSDLSEALPKDIQADIETFYKLWHAPGVSKEDASKISIISEGICTRLAEILLKEKLQKDLTTRH